MHGGGGVVKGLILQIFASLCMSWCGYEMVMLLFKENMSKHNVILRGMCFHQWSWHCAWKVNSTRLTKMQHFLQRWCIFPRMLYFVFGNLAKKKHVYIIYTMILMPAMNSALYCCTYCHAYIYIYIRTIWQIHFFHNRLCFRKICIWYWTDMSAIYSCKFGIFWKVFCILSFCSWVFFRKEHVQVEHALLQKIV